MLFYITYVMLCYITYVMLCYITYVIYVNLCLCCVLFCSVLFCSVRTSSLADNQALVFLLIHSQNVNWITRAQINPRREKMQISFYINQFHLWNNSMFLERIWFFFFFILYTFMKLHLCVKKEKLAEGQALY